jgi:hypothetical protein
LLTAGKRGLEKSTYELPQYVADTGVAEMRAALLEKEQAQGFIYYYYIL